MFGHECRSSYSVVIIVMIYFMFLVVNKGHAMWDQVLARAHSMACDDATESFALLEPGSYQVQSRMPVKLFCCDYCHDLFYVSCCS